MTTLHSAVPESSLHPAAAPTAPSPEPAAVVEHFLDLLRDGDFDALEALFTEDAWIRALLVKTVHESTDAAGAAAGLRQWVGSPHGRKMLDRGRHGLAGRQFLRYRFLVRPFFAPEQWHVVEQSGYCRVVDGRIRRMDLACTGYFPADPEEVRRAGLEPDGA